MKQPVTVPQEIQGVPARLIPTWGVSNDTEAEMRVTSATLAVMTVVRDFSNVLLAPLGAPTAGKAVVEAFTETYFKGTDGSVLRPDGLVRVTFGKRSFVALIEVKTGSNTIKADQVNSYWDVARNSGFQAVLTISNELAVGGEHPTKGLKVRSNSAVRVHHMSWTQLVAHAVTCKVHRGVTDPEQSWLLGELIRYLESGASGVVRFDDMGGSWNFVRDSARNGVLSKSSEGLSEVVERWDQLIRFTSLQLGSEIGADVEQIFPRGLKDSKARQQLHVESLCSTGSLTGALKIPNAVGPIAVEADLRARLLTTSVEVGAPNDRGNRARVAWLLRQLGDDRLTGITIEAWGKNARQPAVGDLIHVRENPLLLADDAGRDIVRFRVIRRFEMGPARSSGGKRLGFVRSVLLAVDAFYEGIVQRLALHVPKAPQISRRIETALDEQGVEGMPIQSVTAGTSSLILDDSTASSTDGTLEHSEAVGDEAIVESGQVSTEPPSEVVRLATPLATEAH